MTVHVQAGNFRRDSYNVSKTRILMIHFYIPDYPSWYQARKHSCLQARGHQTLRLWFCQNYGGAGGNIHRWALTTSGTTFLTLHNICPDYVATRWYRAPELLVGDPAYGKEVHLRYIMYLNPCFVMKKFRGIYNSCPGWHLGHRVSVRWNADWRPHLPRGLWHWPDLPHH